MKSLITLGSMLMIAALVSAGPQREPVPATMQIALLLDTSNSMDGLINQAKSQLWKIVNELALAKKDGRNAKLQVALFEYGKDSLAQSDGYLQMLVPLTTDLDRISEVLFGLTTNGGQEYCGLTIHAAGKLAWSQSPRDYRAIFIAGNEAFNQGDFDYRKACAESIGKGIVVNTIFCGPEREGIATFWKEGADLADGRFMCIDQNQVMESVAAPQDKEILDLDKDLNQTFIAYGRSGAGGKVRQEAQDANAMAAAPSAAVERAFTKASKVYQTEDWDLVNAVKEKKVKLEEVAEEALPEVMRDMSGEEKEAYLAEQDRIRQEIGLKLENLKQARAAYLAKYQEEKGGGLDSAIVVAIRDQLKSRDFKFPQH